MVTPSTLVMAVTLALVLSRVHGQITCPAGQRALAIRLLTVTNTGDSTLVSLASEWCSPHHCHQAVSSTTRVYEADVHLCVRACVVVEVVIV